MNDSGKKPVFTFNGGDEDDPFEGFGLFPENVPSNQTQQFATQNQNNNNRSTQQTTLPAINGAANTTGTSTKGQKSIPVQTQTVNSAAYRAKQRKIRQRQLQNREELINFLKHK